MKALRIVCLELCLLVSSEATTNGLLLVAQNPTLTAEQHINTAREAIQSEKYGDAKKDLATGWMAKP
ncbi:MAG: hypothetical protein WAV47_08645 [Blastocatellia bacterium]